MRRNRLFRPTSGRARALLLALAAIIALAVVLIWVIGWSWLRGPIVAALERATGRPVELASVDVDWNWRFEPLITLEGLSIGNAAWSRRETMLALDRADLRLRLWPLLRGEWELPEVSVEGLDVTLERSRETGANWEFTPARESAEDTERDSLPKIGALRLRDGRVRFFDRDRALELETTVETRPAKNGAGDRLRLVGQGRLEGRALRFEAEGDALASLGDGGEPYALSASLTAGATRASFDGKLGARRVLEGLSGAVRLSGTNLADIFPLTGVPVPDTPPYTLQSRLWYHDGVWTADELAGKIGDSDLGGSVAVDTRQDPPFVNANLESRLLDFDDLGAIFGLPVRTGDGETASAEQKQLAAEYAARERVLPNASLDISRLAAANARLEFRGAEVDAPGLPLENVALVMRLEKRTLTFDPLEIGLRGGRITGTASIDARNLPVESVIDLRLREFDLQTMFPNNRVGGLLRGRFELSGVGPSVRAAAETADGRLRLGIDRGHIDKRTLELIGLDLLDFLLTPQGEQERMSCALFDFAVADGVARREVFLITAGETAVAGEGEIRLGAEQIDLSIQARDENATLGALGGPIKIGGTFKAPMIGLGTETIVRGAAAAALGVLLSPIAALLATIELGDAPDAPTPCAELRKRAAEIQ